MKKRALSLFCTVILFISIFSLPAKALYTPPFDLNATAVLLYNIDTNTMVYEKNADQKMYPASLTKVVTAMLALEKVADLDAHTVTAKKELIKMLDGTGSTMGGIVEGEILTMRQLVNSILVHSANEASNIIADDVGGGLDNFITIMNDRAKELGAKNTHFANAHGLQDENHYTTARDMFLIVKHAIELPGFMDIVSQTRYTIPATNKNPARTLVTTNQMMDKNAANGAYFYAPVKGIKTGYTDEAGRCFVSTATQNGYNYLCIVMGAPTKDNDSKTLTENLAFVDTKKLYTWAFDNFKVKEIINTKEPVAEMKIGLASQKDTIQLYPRDAFSTIIPKDIDPSSVVKSPNLLTQINAPIEKGQDLGYLSLQLAGEEIGRVSLVSNENVKRSSLLFVLNQIGTIINSVGFKVIVGIIVFIILAYIVLSVKQNRKKKNLKKVKNKKYRRM